MTPSFMILFAWFAFAGTHLWMSASGLRERLAPHYGHMGFTLIYLIVTVLSLSILIASLALYGDQGLAGFQLTTPFLLWSLRIGSAVGAFLVVTGLIGYPKSPIAILARRIGTSQNNNPLRPPTGIARITRHPFFVGLALISLCHIFLASSLAIATFFVGLFVISALGIPLQDRKLRNRWAAVYARYEQQSSTLPFGSLHKQTDKPTTKDWISWIICLLVAIALFGVFHPLWTHANGAGFVILILIYGTLGTVIGIVKGLKARRLD
ncbi:MAG: NnrU family protein [Sneathiella sp.]